MNFLKAYCVKNMYGDFIVRKTKSIVQLFLAIFIMFSLSGCLPNNEKLQVMLDQNSITKKFYIRNDTNVYDGYGKDKKVLDTLKRGKQYETADIKDNYVKVAKSDSNGLKSDVWVSMDEIEEEPTYFVTLIVDVPNANILINGENYEPNMRLPKGKYIINISAEQFLDKSLEIDVQEDTKESITLEFDVEAQKERLAKEKIEKEKIERKKREKERLAKEIKDSIYIDNTQKLMWQDNIIVSVAKKPWLSKKNFDAKKDNDTSGDTAASYCKNIVIANLKDWRLPTKDELKNLFAQKGRLKHVAADWYWSSTSNTNNGERAWTIHFNNGDGYSDLKDANNFVRCVRDGIKLPK
ncbi:DUF1566 domain-containing protein [Halarcobacter ebronensis]|uniref:Lcl C-terminal domain-containing protein n=1 Tax=Halarcobacter ebronensis TaxID=1462615 RepID=A0A4Q1AMH6_9BACT|nr:DUF1566 domain-containing protein [Halarcobacter ebronensis]RXK04871.1 hypothetical protein CRV07_09785 [Halarcobacter ebronensis]